MREIDKTEKITINLGLVDLGPIDLLVQEGFYSNVLGTLRASPGVRAALAGRIR